MSEKAFGLAGDLEKSSQIYYESIFSQFQIGRVVDLLSALASKTGVDVSGFRTVLNAGLAQACRYQGFFNSTIAPIDPVSIEYGTDASRAALSIVFTVEEEFKSEFEAIAETKQNSDLELITRMGCDLVIRYHKETSRAEFSYSIALTPAAQATPKSIHFIFIEKEENASVAENKYVELGDVKYETLLGSEKAGTSDDHAAKKMVVAATSAVAKAEAQISQEIDQAVAQNRSKEAVAEALVEATSVEHMAESIKRNLTKEEIAKFVATGDTKKLAEILARTVPEEQLTEGARAAIASQDQTELVSQEITPAEKAKIKAQVDPAEAGKLLKKTVEKTEINRLIAESLPDEKKAEFLAQQLSSEEVAQIVSENLEVGDKARILAHFSPAQSVELIKNSCNETELANILAEQLTAEEKGKILKEALPVEEVCELLSCKLSDEEKATIIAAGNQNFAAKVLKQAHSPEQMATILAQSLPDEERAELLSEGMNTEEISQLITASLPEQDRAKFLAQANPEAVAQVLRDSYSEGEFAQVVRDSFSKEELAQVVRGSFSEDEFAQLVKGSMSEAELKTLVKGGEVEQEGEHRTVFKSSAKSKPAPVKERIVSEDPTSPEKEELVRMVSGGVLKPEQVEKMITSAMQDPQLAKTLFEQIPKTQLAEAIKANVDPQVMSRTMQSVMKPVQIAEVLSAGLPPSELATLLTSAMPAAARAKELVAHLPVEEIARVISSGAKEKQEEPKAPKISSVPTQKVLEPAQVAKLLNPDISKEDALSVLTKVLPQHAAESIFTGVIPKEEIAKALAPYLPNPEFSSAVAASLMRLKGVLHSQAVQKDIESVYQAKLDDSKKSIEFYLVRARKLETQLQEAEAQKRNLQRDAEKARVELEKAVSQEFSKNTEVSADPKAAKDREALLLFQRKAREFEKNLHHAEAEIRRLNAEHTKELLQKTKQEKVSTAGQSSDPQVSQSPQVKDAQVKDLQVKDLQIKDLQGKLVQSQEAITALTSAYEKRIKALQDKINTLPAQGSSAQAASTQTVSQQMATPAQPVSALPGPAEAEAARPATAQAAIAQSATAQSVTGQSATGQSATTHPATTPVASGQQSVPASPEGSAEMADEIDKEVTTLDQGLTGIVRKVEALKSVLPNDTAKRTVDGLMTAVMQEKARFTVMAREMTASIRKKEFSLKNQEIAFIEEIKKGRSLADQKQGVIDRQKQQIQEMSQKMTQDKSQTAQAVGADSQFRLKFEQSLRQIEVLNKEIEKAKKRAQPAPDTQAAATLQRDIVKFKKEAETIAKALQAKKQEADVLKQQIQDKDKRETEYKRTIMKLQSELNVAQTAAKKAS